MHRAFMLGVVLCASIWPHPVPGQAVDSVRLEPRSADTTALNLDEVRRLALTRNPAFHADLQRIESARGDLRSARTYPFNPTVEVEGPGSLTGAGVRRYELRVGQEIEWAGQGARRVEAAEAGVLAAGDAVLDDARLLLADVEDAWYTLAAAERRFALAREIEALNARLLEAVRVQLTEGEVSVLQANLVEIESARARARVLDLEREASGAELTLGRLLGLGPETRLRASAVNGTERSLPPAAAADALVAAALSVRPDLAAARSGVERADALRSLATREAIPNLRVDGLAGREDPSTDPRFGLALSLPIPLFDRNQGLRARRDAELEEASFVVRAVEMRVRTEVTDALRAYETTCREVEVYEEDVLEPARQNQDLLDIAYREGKLDLSSLLLLRNQLLDAELGYWEAWERHHEAAVALRSATAAILEDADAFLPENLR